MIRSTFLLLVALLSVIGGKCSGHHPPTLKRFLPSTATSGQTENDDTNYEYEFPRCGQNINALLNKVNELVEHPDRSKVDRVVEEIRNITEAARQYRSRVMEQIGRTPA